MRHSLATWLNNDVDDDHEENIVVQKYHLFMHNISVTDDRATWTNIPQTVDKRV